MGIANKHLPSFLPSYEELGLLHPLEAFFSLQVSRHGRVAGDAGAKEMG